MHIYLIGGKINSREQDYTGSCFRFNLRGLRTWTEMPSLKMARAQHSSCVHGSSIYVIGGMHQTAKGYLAMIDIERLDLAQID